MSDVDLRAALKALHDRVDFDPDSVPAIGTRSPGRRPWILSAAAALLVGLGITGLVVVNSGSPTDRAPADPQADAVRAPWSSLVPEPPLTPRRSPLVVDHHGALFVWGGQSFDDPERSLADGAIYDLESSTWRPIAPAPAIGSSITGASSGDSIVVVGTTGLARYVPATDSWTTLEAPPAAGDITHVVGAGSSFVLYPMMVRVQPALDAAGWESLAAPPELPVAASVAADDERMVVVGAPEDGSVGGVVLVYEIAEDRWGTHPSNPLFQFTPGDGVGIVDGELLVVSTVEQRVAALDLDDSTWRELPPFPSLPAKCAVGVLTVDDVALVEACAQTAALAHGAAQWIPFDAPGDSHLLRLAGLDGGAVVNGAILDPARDGEWWRDLARGPATVGGLTIDRDDLPVEVADVGPSTMSLTVRGGECTLAVGPGTDETERRLADASTGSASSAEFWNSFGRYNVECATPGALDAVLDHLTVRGERTDPTTDDLLTEATAAGFDEEGDLVEHVAAVLEEQVVDGAVGAGVSVSAPYGQPTTYRFDVMSPGTDGEIGVSFVVTIEETTAGWQVTASTRQAICAFGVAQTAPDRCASRRN